MRRNVIICGTYIGTCTSRAMMDSEPGAVYREFQPDRGVPLPSGDMHFTAEDGLIRYYDGKGVLQLSRRITDIIQALKG